ncbi:LysR substrate-binding domain-containing protein [Celerinatantimonas sp. YJH-8]|uniref:LysR substrate-binding domain-containing protein n=1 Tax=Celerinatantimonas sp. YJH-8 TaxID=3228714 RepID=UPI0038CBB861
MDPTLHHQQLLANMHTFCLAANSLSFTKAAEALCITQGAVSQRIKCLEEQLGFSLFVRMTRKLALTVEGQRLLDVLTPSFNRIFSEIDDIKFNELSGELYIGVAPTFAKIWLLPKLTDFHEQYPNLNMKIRMKGSPLNFQQEPVDIAIYYSDGRHPNFVHQRLFDEALTPVCSPDYFRKLFGSDTLPKHWESQFREATFIHNTESLEFIRPDEEWNEWLDRQSNPALKSVDVLAKHYIINHCDMTIDAAEAGMGMSMARTLLVRDRLRQGALVAPFERVKAKLGYDLIFPMSYASRPKIQAFIQWLNTQITLESVSQDKTQPPT